MNLFALRVFVAAALLAAPATAQRWRAQYFHDDPKLDLRIRAIAFSTPSVGVAVGVTVARNGNGARKPVALMTANGGEKWTMTPLKEMPVSVFFVDGGVGWMVSENGLWRTMEGGRDWTKLPKPPARINKVFFVDEKTGWAACEKKTILATVDGGVSWSKVSLVENGAPAPKSAYFYWLDFLGGHGVAIGRDPGVGIGVAPDLYPEAATRRREIASVMLSAETTDGGKSWKASSGMLTGALSKTRRSSEGLFALLSHSDSAQYPSEVLFARNGSATREMIFRDKKVFVSDIWLGQKGVVYLTGTAVTAPLRGVIPEKVKVLRSADRKNWTTMEVDYRAVAQVGMFAGAGDDLWVATDRGLIMKLEQ